MAGHKIYTMTFSRIYHLYIAKVERKGKTKEELDEIIRWLTGYSQEGLEEELEKETTMEDFLAQSPLFNPLAVNIKGLICGVRIEEIEEETMRKIRYMDKLVDDLAKGRSMDKILQRNK